MGRIITRERYNGWDCWKLRVEILRLPTQDRAELAYCLNRSLDDSDSVVSEADFEVELERR
jgi:hypothetical protein